MSTVLSTQPSPSMQQALAELETCTERAIFTPGLIQPHGLLLVLSGPELTIGQESQNVEDKLGWAAPDLVGKSLKQVLPPGSDYFYQRSGSDSGQGPCL